MTNVFGSIGFYINKEVKYKLQVIDLNKTDHVVPSKKTYLFAHISITRSVHVTPAPAVRSLVEGVNAFTVNGRPTRLILALHEGRSSQQIVIHFLDSHFV